LVTVFIKKKMIVLKIVKPGNTKGRSITVPLTSSLTGLESADNFCFYLQNRLIQTSQTVGQQYSDTSPFSIPWLILSYFSLPIFLYVHGSKQGKLKEKKCFLQGRLFGEGCPIKLTNLFHTLGNRYYGSVITNVIRGQGP
jgi:hypothetical protein